MTVTIHSILNSVLWGGALSVGLSVLSRNRFVLCRFGVYPLAVLSAACLLRCCLPVELTVTKEVGAAALNRVHKLIDRVASSPAPEFWFFKVWLAGAVLGLVLWLSRYIFRLRAAKRLPISTDSQIQSICKGIGVNGLRIVVTPKAYTPCVIGLWSETILLPDSEYTNRQLENILRYEYAHTKHHDGLLDVILCLLCILFWWNPGVLICRMVIVRLYAVIFVNLFIFLCQQNIKSHMENSGKCFQFIVRYHTAPILYPADGLLTERNPFHLHFCGKLLLCQLPLFS